MIAAAMCFSGVVPAIYTNIYHLEGTFYIKHSVTVMA